MSASRLLFYLYITVFQFSQFSVFAQNKYTVSGYVKEKKNGESLPGVNVYVKETMKGGSTNEFGFYSFTIPEGNYTLSASFLGFQNFEQPITLNQNLRINIEMLSAEIVTQVVEVTGVRKDKNVESTDMGTVDLQIEQIKSIPALLGEVDIFRTLQLLPGVMSAGEGNSGFYVRGGGPDQNLVLLDQAVVYNPGHLFGFFSVFNSDAIKNVNLIKGGMPANYGGRLSSVVDVSMKEGNMKKYNVEGGIGLISSRLTIQGPIKKDKCSFIVSGRRTYIDLISKPFMKKIKGGEFAGNSYYFYDVNAKFNYIFSDKDRLYVSGYFGRDVFTYNDQTFNVKIPWGNATATMRWNHLFSNKLFMNVIALYNDYNFAIESKFQDVRFNLYSGIRDVGGKVDLDYYPNANHAIKFGGEHTWHTFIPYTVSGSSGGENIIDVDKINRKYGHESAIYVLDDFTVTEWLKINAGLRGSMFNNVGPQNKYLFDENNRPTDTLEYKRSQHIKTYLGIEPRINLRFALNESMSVKTSFTYNSQYIHLVSSSTTTLPTDLWVPSTAMVKPQRGYQAAAGFFKNFKDNMFETSIEVYFKKMNNQIEFGQSFVPELGADIEDAFVFGDAISYGSEFFVKKAYGKWNGWVGYTLSRTQRKFLDLNDGKTFPAKYDRRHDAKLVLIYDISKRWNVSATFVYGTGIATTVPVGRYFIEGQIVNQYGDRNDYRLKPYHRADISATYIMKRKKYYSDITISVYNLYNRRNPYFIYFDVEGDIASGNLNLQAKQVSLFPILPSITWNFKF
jgi:hypothetical protein